TVFGRPHDASRLQRAEAEESQSRVDGGVARRGAWKRGGRRVGGRAVFPNGRKSQTPAPNDRLAWRTARSNPKIFFEGLARAIAALVLFRGGPALPLGGIERS